MGRNTKTGLSFYAVDTDRYQDMRIKRLKKSFGCQGIAVYDYLLCEIYRVNGCFLEWDENTAFDVAEYFGIKENSVKEIVQYCAAVGLYNKELLSRGIITSRSIQERYLTMCEKARRNNVTIPENYCLIDKKETSAKHEIPQPPANNNSQVPIRAPKNITDVYSALCKAVDEREDVWEAAAISGSFQNEYTQHYREWLMLTPEQRKTYPLHVLNSTLRQRCGDINIEFYNAYGWCKDNLLESDIKEIYPIIVKNQNALNELRKLIKEVKKGKINNPGLFIIKKLRAI